jgi:hypothetical protein
VCTVALAGEGGRRPDEGGIIKNNAKNLVKNFKSEKIMLILFVSKKV